MMDKSIKINEDLLMNYILFSNANMSVFQDICKYHYLIRSISASRGSLNQHKIFDPIRVKQLILDMRISGMTESAKKAYIGTCINVYNSLMLDKSNHFIQEEQIIWKFVKEHKEWIENTIKESGIKDERMKEIFANILKYEDNDDR